ncbi:MAG: hypothetical protein ABI673_05660 [Novosphingobium sp.]
MMTLQGLGRTVLIVLAALLSQPAYAGQAKQSDAKLPKFTNFPVAMMKGPIPPLQLVNDDMMFRTRIRQLYEASRKYGPNFAGHYAVTDVGCGTFCTFLITIDMKTGRTVWLHVPSGEDVYVCDDAYTDAKGETPGENGNKFYFKPNSRLFVVTGKLPGNDCGARYFEEKDGQMRMIRDVQLDKRK